MLEIKEIKYKAGDFVLGPISLTVQGGEYWIVAGPSGSGKTTLLELLSGLRRAREGCLLFQGTDITHQPVHQRQVGIIFQDIALFPHLTVEQNIAYPLLRQGKHKIEITHQVQRISALIGIQHLLLRRPKDLSGGEARRVAIARTLAMQPRVLLLDEPLSGIDANLKQSLYEVLRNLCRPDLPIIHVTHDPEEALALATHLAVIKEGKILQSGPIHQVLLQPTDEFVARFAGIRNFYPCELSAGPDPGLAWAIIQEGHRICLPAPDKLVRGHISIPASDIILSANKISSSARNLFQGTITEIIPVRHGIEISINCGFALAALISRSALIELDLKEGSQVWATFKASSVQFIPY